MFESEEELSYGEILANLSLHGELTIVIPIDQEDAVKVGLKNLKSRQVARIKKEGLPTPEEILIFYSTPSEDYPDSVDLKILLRKKGTVLVQKMIFPDNTFS